VPKRDSQKSKVYAAENVISRFYDTATKTGNPVVNVNGVTVTLPPEAKFASVESIQRYVEQVLAMPAIREAHPTMALSVPTVRHRKGTRIAHYQNGEIAIPTDRAGSWAMRELVVLHELAHHLAFGDGHGPRFVSTLLHMMGVVLGPEVELIARMTFADCEVNAVPPADRREFFASA
jgi:putative metallohydrolase (TIGR04338 family)